MPESWIATEGQAVNAALAQFRVATSSASDQDLIDRLLFLKSVVRQAEHDALHTIAQLDSDGVFLERGMRTATAIADLPRCTSKEANRLVATAASVFPTSLAGEPLEPRLPATALGGWEIDRAHAEVIEGLLSSDAAQRLDPETWSGVEAQLADAARQYRPNELAHHGATLIELLDQDGPPPARSVNTLSTTATSPPKAANARTSARSSTSRPSATKPEAPGWSSAAPPPPPISAG